jgi:hypothetical protein
MKQFCVLLVLVAAASAASDTDGLVTTALKFVKDCNDKSLTLCIKVRIYKKCLPLDIIKK